VSLADLHAAQARRLAAWPAAMTALSTHDTKRGEDVRARLAVLSELPDAWAEALGRWRAAAPVPDPSFEHLMWQTVAGAWPIERDRLEAYLLKAAREANRSTAWTDGDPAFEGRIGAALDRLYAPGALRDDVSAFVEKITGYGWSNALGQKLVQLLSPGVPDTYQGTELWDNSLVDPDNRRPVDFARRRELLARLDGGWRPPVDATGAVKLLVVSRTLRTLPRVEGFEPLDGGEHVVAFRRGPVIAVATRLPVGLDRAGGWARIQPATLPLPAGVWTDELTGRPAVPRLAELLSEYPVALLVRADD
jgi:(1->4)-alpha-D-glucan 1-alpha-D-glucosylmutase